MTPELGRALLDEARERLVKGFPAQVVACGIRPRKWSAASTRSKRLQGAPRTSGVERARDQVHAARMELSKLLGARDALGQPADIGRAAWLSTGAVSQKLVATTAAVTKAMEMSLRILWELTSRNADIR